MVDITDLVSPVEEEEGIVPSQELDTSELISPVAITQTAEEVKEIAPEIGPLEELEGFLTIGSSLLATPVAGIEGLKRQLLQDLGFQQDVSPAQAIEDVSKALTYQPRTEGGKEFAETLATPFELLDKAGQWVGDKVFEITDSPAIAANAKAATMFAVPKGLHQTFRGGKWVAKKGVATVGSFSEITKQISPKQRKTFSQEAVGRSLRENIGESPEVTANITKAAALEKAIPGFRPTLAETTLKPSVVVREKVLAAAEQRTFDIAKARRQANERALEDFRQENFGDSAPEIAAILKKSEGNINKANTALENRRIELEADRAALAKRAPHTSLDKVGERLRAIEEAEYKVAKAQGNLLYEKVGNVKVQPEAIYREVDSIFKNELLDFTPEQIPSSFSFIRRQLAPVAPKVTEGRTMAALQARQPAAPQPSVQEISFDSLRSIERRLGHDLAAERGKLSGRDRTKEHLIGRVLEKVDEIKTGLEQTGSADVVHALREANSFWKEGVVDRFYKGAGRDIDAKTPMNEYRIVDEKVIDSFFAPATRAKGGVKAIDDFITTFGMNPEAWGQLRLGIYEKFRAATGVDKTGLIDPTKATVWLDKHRSILDRIPAIRDELVNLHDANLNLAAGQRLLKQRETNIQHSILSKAVNTMTPDTAVKSAIKESPIEMTRLKIMAKKVKGGTEALSKEVGRQVLQLAERKDGTIDSNRLLQTMTRNEKSLRTGMGSKHFETLKTIHEAYARLDKIILPEMVKEPKIGLEMVGEKFGTTPAQAISAWRAHSRGLVGGPHLVAQLGTSFITRINKNQINAIERIAHYDPEVASTLMMMVKSDKLAPIAEKRMMKHIADYGLTGLGAAEGLEDE